jgi:hypothetical protein
MMRNVNETETGSFAYTNPYFQFEGTTLGGKAHGFGVLLMGDGTSLSGVFAHGDLTGEACKRWEDGSFYVGGFVKGEMHGSGRWVRISDGTEYRGDVVRGAKEGHGKEFHMRQRTLYEGPFHLGRYHGIGVMLKFPPATPIDVELSPKEVRDATIGAEATMQQHSNSVGGVLDEDPVVIIRGIPMVVEVPAALDASVNSNVMTMNAVGGRGGSIVFPGASSSTFPAGGGGVESTTSLPVGFLPPSIVTLALRRMKSIKFNESTATGATAVNNKISPDKKGSPEPSVARSRSPPNDGATSSSNVSGTFTLIHGPFVGGLLHGCGVTVRFANGDLFEGTAVKGELEGPSCEFLALCAGGSVPLQYRGPMKASRRAEVPTDIIVQDIYHESTGSVLHQLTGDGAGTMGVACTTSVLLVLQQVTRRTVTETVTRVDPKKKAAAVASKSSTAALKRGEDDVPTKETVTRDVFDPCIGESGRPVRAKLYKLAAPLTATQLKSMKRPPRDATKALFATEPLTPRPDDSRNGSQTASQTASPRTPNALGERGTARSPSDGRRTEEGDSLTPSSSKVLGKPSKSQSSRSLASTSKGSPMMHFPLDSGKALLQMTMQDGAISIKLAPLCREAGDYLAKIEVFHGGGFPTCPGGTGTETDDGMAPLPQNIFWIPLRVLR